MGILLSCCPGVGSSTSDTQPITVDAALRREQMAQAAEKRRQADESRGLKTEEAKKKLKDAQTVNLNEPEPNLDVEGGLKWQVD